MHFNTIVINQQELIVCYVYFNSSIVLSLDCQVIKSPSGRKF